MTGSADFDTIQFRETGYGVFSWVIHWLVYLHTLYIGACGTWVLAVQVWEDARWQIGLRQEWLP